MQLAPMQLARTPDGWLKTVLEDFDSFLKDHASCEKKASGMAISIASHYPDQPVLLAAMADLAVEEMSHYREVVKLLISRGVTPGPDSKDPYVHALSDLIRRGSASFLMDRLLIAAVIERRGHERFSILADGLAGQPEAAFYRAIAASEDRHWQLFIDLAQKHCDASAIPDRLEQLIAAEAALVTSLPFRPALH